MFSKKMPGGTPSVVGPGRNHLIWLLSLLVAAATLLTGQARFGELQGVATDATGAVVPNSKASLTETTSNRVTNVATGNDGTYVFRNLEPGTYRLRVEQSGFNAYEVPNINIA